MRYLVLADIHSNLDALNSVLKEAEKIGFERILCLGDIVGYGPEPNRCVEVMREKEAICIMGNHDAAACNLVDLNWFNPHAKECIIWTKKILTAENKKFLKELPIFFSTKFLYAVHGTPKDPIMEYMDLEKAREALEMVIENLILVGHTHESFYYIEGKAETELIPDDKLIEFEGKRIVVNVPAVGQPRDGNPNAGFAILDFEKKIFEVKRVNYDIESAAKKIIKAGLPTIEAERLFKGF